MPGAGEPVHYEGGSGDFLTTKQTKGTKGREKRDRIVTVDERE
jgi:hypothetical protein